MNDYRKPSWWDRDEKDDRSSGWTPTGATRPAWDDDDAWDEYYSTHYGTTSRKSEYSWDRSKGGYSDSFRWSGATNYGYYYRETSDDDKQRVYKIAATRSSAKAIMAVHPRYGSGRLLWGNVLRYNGAGNPVVPMTAAETLYEDRETGGFRDRAQFVDVAVGNALTANEIAWFLEPIIRGEMDTWTLRLRAMDTNRRALFASAATFIAQQNVLDSAPGFGPYFDARIASYGDDMGVELENDPSDWDMACAWLLTHGAIEASDTAEELAKKAVADCLKVMAGEKSVSDAMEMLDAELVVSSEAKLAADDDCMVGETLLGTALGYIGYYPEQDGEQDNDGEDNSEDQDSDGSVSVNSATGFEIVEDWQAPVFVTEFREIRDTSVVPALRIKALAANIEAAVSGKLAFRHEVERHDIDKRSGDLDEGGLHKLALHSDRVFMIREQETVPNIQVGVLLDRSGSMSHRAGEPGLTRWYYASATGLGFRNALVKQKGIDFNLYAHTQICGRTLERDEDYMGWGTYTPDPNWGGRDTDDLVVVERIVDQDVDHAAAMVPSFPLSGNLDGTAIKAVIKEMMKRDNDYRKRILFVVSDGQPCDGYDAVASACEYAANMGIKVYGIGIDPAVFSIENGEHMYGPGGFIIADPSRLPSVLATWLARVAASLQ